MKSQTSSLVQRCITALGSKIFFLVVMGFFLLQAAWIMFTARYPMAFDEDFHLGIIQLFAHHLSPFWAAQPAGADQFGAIVRDPSYFYHYLMSFPYRFISLFTDNQTIQVLFLRALNIGFFAVGLVLFRRFILRMGTSKQITNLSLLVFILLPITSLLAAQINYDNLLLPVLATVLLLTQSACQGLSKQRLSTRNLLLICILSLFASLIKYAFLPIFVAIFVFLGVCIWRTFRSRNDLLKALHKSWHTLATWLKWTLLAGLFISGFLFSERYFINFAHYHTPVPSCDQVLSEKQCNEYGPWARDNEYSHNKLEGSLSPFTYTADWVYGMWLRTFFSVDGPGSRFQTRGPLLMPAITSITFGVLTVIVVATQIRKVFRRYDSLSLWLVVISSTVYVLALWINGYSSFLETTRPVAINGRYLLIIWLPIIAIAGMCYSQLLAKKQGWKLALAILVILGMFWGGGVFTYILRSNAQWYWPNHYIVTVNTQIQRVLGPVTPGYNDTTNFLR